MMSTMNILILLAFTLITCVPYNGWPMLGLNSRHAGDFSSSELNASSSVPGTLKWSFMTLGYYPLIREQPAIGRDGTIYFSCWNEKFYALSSNGTQKWTFSRKGGIFSSPALGRDGTIYFGSQDNHVYAVSPNGVLKWNFTNHAINQPFGSPVISSDGSISVGCWNAVIYNIDSKYGKLNWKVNLSAGQYDQIIYTPAVDSSGNVYVGTHGSNGNFYAFKSNGKSKWVTSLSKMSSAGDVAIGPDGVVYVVDYHVLFALNPADGSIKWQYELSSFANGPPLISGTTVYIATDYGSIIAFSTQNGSVLWKFEITYTGSDRYNIVRGISMDSKGVIYFGRKDGKVTAIDSKGNHLWTYETLTKAQIWCYGPTIAGGVLYVGDERGVLHAINT